MQNRRRPVCASSRAPGRPAAGRKKLSRLAEAISYALLCLFCAGALLGAWSCGNDRAGSQRAEVQVLQQDGSFDLATVAGMLRAGITAPDSTDTTRRSLPFQDPKQALSQVYQGCDYQPLWLREDGVAHAARLSIDELDSLRFDGLPAKRYDAADLRTQLNALQPGSSAEELMRFDTSLTAAWLKAASDLHFGILKPRRGDSLWFHANDSSWNAVEALAVKWFRDGALPRLDQFRSRIPLYARVRSRYAELLGLEADAGYNDLRLSLRPGADSLARLLIQRLMQPEALRAAPADSLLKTYQYAFGLPQTNKLDSITVRSLQQAPDSLAGRLAANLERLRWLPQVLEARHVQVNIPLMELRLVDDGAEALRMRAVVGKPSRQTPSLGAAMTNIVFSPAWSVPPTILKKDVLPGLSSRGAGYLRRKGLRVFDRKGRPVDATAVTGANFRNFVYRQPPGARNALGEVKFNLPNDWDIYLHDTPHREDFRKRYRAASSGCIRLEDPKGLAAFILAGLDGKSRYTPEAIDSIIATRKSRWVTLSRPIPVHILYLTVDSESTGVRLLADIYRKDAKLMRRLEALSI